MKQTPWNSPELLSQWFASQRGQEFKQAEIALLDKSLVRLFGAHCALSSVYSDAALVNRIPCRRVYDLVSPSLQVRPRSGYGAHQLIAPIGCLPFEDESLDGFILLHTLDFVENPKDAIREVARVIRPGGQIIIVGFNPASLFGWSRYMPGLRGQLPAYAQFLGRHRLCDWLHLLNFELEYVSGSALMPFRKSALKTESKRALVQGSVWKAARVGLGKAFRERYGGVYCLRVRKSQMGFTLVGPTARVMKPLWLSAGPATAASRNASTNSQSNKILPPQQP